MFFSDIGYYGVVHIVSGRSDRLRRDNIPKRNDRHLGCSAADVDHHTAHRFIHRKPRSESCSHRLLNKINILCARLHRRIVNGTHLNLGNARGNTYHHLGAGNHRSLNCIAYESFKHSSGYVKVGNNAVLKRAHCRNAAGGTAYHFLGFSANRPHGVVSHVHRHNRRFAHNNTLTFNANKGIGCSEIYSDFSCKHWFTPQYIIYVSSPDVFFAVFS